MAIWLWPCWLWALLQSRSQSKPWILKRFGKLVHSLLNLFNKYQYPIVPYVWEWSINNYYLNKLDLDFGLFVSIFMFLFISITFKTLPNLQRLRDFFLTGLVFPCKSGGFLFENCTYFCTYNNKPFLWISRNSFILNFLIFGQNQVFYCIFNFFTEILLFHGMFTSWWSSID